MTERIVIGAGRRRKQKAEKLPITLVGIDYEVTCPKVIRWLSMARMEQAGFLSNPSVVSGELIGFLQAIFGPRQYAQVEQRFNDGDDELDFEHLIALIEHVLNHFEPQMRTKLEAMGVDPDTLNDLDTDESEAEKAPARRKAPAKVRRTR